MISFLSSLWCNIRVSIYNFVKNFLLSSSADKTINLWSIEANEAYEENINSSMINCVAKASFGFKIKNQAFFDTPTSIDWIF